MKIALTLAVLVSTAFAHEGDEEIHWIKMDARRVTSIVGDPFVPKGAAGGSLVLKCLEVKGAPDCPPDITVTADFESLVKEAQAKQKNLGLSGQPLASRQVMDQYMGVWDMEVLPGNPYQWRFKPKFHGYKQGGHQQTHALYTAQEWEQEQAAAQRQTKKKHIDLDSRIDPDVREILRGLFSSQGGN